MSNIPDYQYETKPYQHQKTALERAAKASGYAFFMEMGTGKSKVFIDEMQNMMLSGRINGCLLIAPKGVYMNWINQEFPKHLLKSLKVTIHHWTSYKTKTWVEASKKFMKAEGFRILVMNVDAFSSKTGALYAYDFVMHSKPCLIGVDESTTIKNPQAKRTRTIVKLGRYAAFRRIMSGQPVTRSPVDLFSQCEFLKPGMLGFGSYFAFRNRYCTMKRIHISRDKEIEVVSGYQRLDELQNTLTAFSYRVQKSECLDLPEKVYQTRDVELTEEQVKYYEQMKKDSIMVLNDMEFVTAQIVLTKLLRLHQIVCGHVKTDDGNIIEIPNKRIDGLMEALDETDDKVIIWATYRPDIARIEAALAKEFGPETMVSFHGGVDEHGRADTIRRFQGDPKTRFFVGNPATGRYGLTLVQSATSIYFSNSYDLEHRIQSEDRIHRIGQLRTCNYVDLVVRGTVDEKILKCLRDKKQISSMVLADEWQEWFS